MWKQARKGLGPKMESIKHQRVSFLKDRGVSDVHCSDIREDMGLEEAFCTLMLSVTLSRRGSIEWWVQNLN